MRVFPVLEVEGVRDDDLDIVSASPEGTKRAKHLRVGCIRGYDKRNPPYLVRANLKTPFQKSARNGVEAIAATDVPGVTGLREFRSRLRIPTQARVRTPAVTIAQIKELSADEFLPGDSG